jgi:hypothetical protein
MSRSRLQRPAPTPNGSSGSWPRPTISSSTGRRSAPSRSRPARHRPQQGHHRRRRPDQVLRRWCTVTRTNPKSVTIVDAYGHRGTVPHAHPRAPCRPERSELMTIAARPHDPGAHDSLAPPPRSRCCTSRPRSRAARDPRRADPRSHHRHRRRGDPRPLTIALVIDFFRNPD